MVIKAIVAAIFLVASAAHGQSAAPAGGKSIIADGGMGAFRLVGRDSADAKATLVDAPDQPGRQALRLRTTTKPENPWSIQAQASSIIPLQKGDICLATFLARATETSDVTGDANLGVVFEHGATPNAKSLQRALRLNSQWRRFYLPFAMVQTEDAGVGRMNLLIGYAPQCVEVADFHLLTYGNTRQLADMPSQGSEITYAGREADAPWRKEAAARIEKYRKADLTVLVTDAAGKPVPDAAVKVQMQRQAYQFGAAVTAQMLTADTDDARKYREHVLANFNAIVLENDLKYPFWTAGKTNPRTAAYNDQNTLEALHWLRDHDIYVRGHCLLWGPLDARHYRGFDFDGPDVAKYRQVIGDHVADILGATNGLVGEWDVVNHPVATWGDKGRTWATLYGKEFYADLYRKARATNPNMRLFINEGSDFPGDNEPVRHNYEQMIAWLQSQKAPLDAIGFMSHFGPATLASPQYVYAHIERYAKFGLPMRSTELDVSTDGDERVQADYLRDFMTMFYSHPQTDGIIMWAFWEGRRLKPDTALWQQDWSLKPNGQEWLDLVKRQWWTDVEGKTDPSGRYQTRGFLGTYSITATAGGKSVTENATLAKDGATCRLVVP